MKTCAFLVAVSLSLASTTLSGQSPSDAKAATSTVVKAARILDIRKGSYIENAWQDKVGALEPGHYADLIAVDGDPLTDITVLQHVKFVMKGGAVVKDGLSPPK